jgi:hypothetical protein
MSKLPADPDGSIPVKFVLPEWLLEKKNCWELSEE